MPLPLAEEAALRTRSALAVPEIEGSAWITGDHVFVIDDDDPLRDGFRL